MLNLFQIDFSLCASCMCLCILNGLAISIAIIMWFCSGQMNRKLRCMNVNARSSAVHFRLFAIKRITTGDATSIISSSLAPRLLGLVYKSSEFLYPDKSIRSWKAEIIISVINVQEIRHLMLLCRMIYLQNVYFQRKSHNNCRDITEYTLDTKMC